MTVLERFVVLLYDRTSNLLTVNDAREELFPKRTSLESIPPSRAALVQHAKRATFQGGHIWGQTLLPQPTLPSPSDWGWSKNKDKWTPLWTTLPQAKDTCYELIRCGCKSACRRRCKCKKGKLGMHWPLQMWRQLPRITLLVYIRYICSGEASPKFGHANANFSVFIGRIRNQFLKK